jgi:hypothetical protein
MTIKQQVALRKARQAKQARSVRPSGMLASAQVLRGYSLRAINKEYN